MEDLPLIHHPYENHNDNKRAYIRDAMLAINDGLISTVLLSLGIYASGFNKTNILYTLISGSLAGVISMGCGEYLATKSQLQMIEAEIRLEKYHIKHNLPIELKQVEDFLRMDLHISDRTLIQNFIKDMSQNKEGLLNFMKKIEFGITEDDYRNPYVAMSISGLFFFIGSFPSLLSFCFPYSIYYCMILSLCINCISLFCIGVIKALLTKNNACLSGLENIGFAGIGGIISYIVGYSAKFFYHQ